MFPDVCDKRLPPLRGYFHFSTVTHGSRRGLHPSTAPQLPHSRPKAVPRSVTTVTSSHCIPHISHLQLRRSGRIQPTAQAVGQTTEDGTKPRKGRKKLNLPPPTTNPTTSSPPPPKIQIRPIQRSLAFADARTMNSPCRNGLSRGAAKERSPRRKP
jgi:hypothetical protein